MNALKNNPALKYRGVQFHKLKESELKSIVADVIAFYNEIKKLGLYIHIVITEEEGKEVEQTRVFFDELYQFCSYQKNGKCKGFLKKINVITKKLFHYHNRRGNQCHVL